MDNSRYIEDNLHLKHKTIPRYHFTLDKIIRNILHLILCCFLFFHFIKYFLCFSQWSLTFSILMFAYVFLVDLRVAIKPPNPPPLPLLHVYK